MMYKSFFYSSIPWILFIFADMVLKKEKQLKLYYSIGEVAKMFGVSETLLRYWETEFPMIAPKKSKRNIRQYRKEDIENIRVIYHLVKEKGMTLAGAKQAMKGGKVGTQKTVDVIDRLKGIRQELLEIKRSFDMLT